MHSGFAFMFVFGYDYFGYVNRVPSYFCVATRFAHISYIPIYRLGTWALGDSDRSIGYPMRLSWKSVFVAWVRGLLALALAVTGVILICDFDKIRNRPNDPALAVGSVIGMVLLVWGYLLTYLWGKPTLHQAYRLARLVGADLSEVADQFPIWYFRERYDRDDQNDND
jgi:hypothetical protein